jgi:hypothetical protein
MNKQAKVAFGVTLTLIVLTAMGLSRVQSLQRLGTPGVRVIKHNVYREDGELVGTNSIALPERVLNFESKEQPIAKVVSDWLPKDTTYCQRIYQAPDGFWTQANVVLMGTDRTSIHDPKYCLAGQGFQTEKVEQLAIDIDKPRRYSLPVVKMTVRREATLENGSKVTQSAIYVFWFVADQQLTANHKERMWWMARDLMTKGVLQRWAYVSCFTACPPGQEEATYARICEWITAAVPHFQLAGGSGGNLAFAP